MIDKQGRTARASSLNRIFPTECLCVLKQMNVPREIPMNTKDARTVRPYRQSEKLQHKNKAARPLHWVAPLILCIMQNILQGVLDYSSVFQFSWLQALFLWFVKGVTQSSPTGVEFANIPSKSNSSTTISGFKYSFFIIKSFYKPCPPSLSREGQGQS